MSTVPTELTVNWQSLGRLNYDEALALMESRASALLREEDDIQTVFAVEHPPTVTVGKNGTFDHILATRSVMEQMGFSVYEVDRGGDVTYHGPGQWVIYPVLHLSPWRNDVGRFVRMLEEVAIRAVGDVGIQAERMEGFPGAWVGRNKICAVGARMKRRPSGEFVTSHGIALNVNTDLSHFNFIVPCGLYDKGVTSVAQELSAPVVFSEWEGRLQSAFAEVFGCQIDQGE